MKSFGPICQSQYNCYEKHEKVSSQNLDFKSQKLLHCTIDRVYNSNLCRIREFMSEHKLFEDIDIEKYKVLISSTSFTPDEDFNILLDALKIMKIHQTRHQYY